MLVVMIALYTVILCRARRSENRDGAGTLSCYLPARAGPLLHNASVLPARTCGSQHTGSRIARSIVQNVTIIPQYLVLLLFPVDLTIYHTADPERDSSPFPRGCRGLDCDAGGLWLLYRKGTGQHFSAWPGASSITRLLRTSSRSLQIRSRSASFICRQPVSLS